MTEVIASIVAEDVATLLVRARQAAMAGADWVELRLDRLPRDLDPQPVLAALHLPVLVACRTPRDGGSFRGTLAERCELFLRWIRAGVAGIDLEDWEAWEVPEPAGLRLQIRSHHNLTGVDDDLPGLRDRLLGRGANCAKIAVTAHDFADARPLIEMLSATDQEQTPTIAFAMGADAWPTRVLSGVLGAPFVYGSVAGGQETARGQLPVAELVGLYRVGRHTPGTLIYGVLGNPARHSLGPLLFNRAFRHLGHDAVYLPFTSSRPDAVLAMLSPRRLRGLSITTPHKEALVRHCHDLDPAARQTGAINTLTWQAHGQVHGAHTDVEGVGAALRRAGLHGLDPDLDPGAPAAGADAGAAADRTSLAGCQGAGPSRGVRAQEPTASTAGGSDGAGGQRPHGVVLGGGGAARAAAVALAALGLQVTIMPRSLDRIRAFARRHGYQLARQDAGLLTGLRPLVVVHATPVGGPDDAGRRILPDWQIPAGTFVLDMVYQVGRTRLLADARAAGAIAVSGLDMFLAQAREQLHRFTGAWVAEDALAGWIGGR